MNNKDQAQFDDMTFNKQKEVFFKSAYTDRGDLLLRSQDPALLANAMSSEEMYLVTRDMDMDMRAEVLKYANLGQLFFMSDLDCWRKDRISKKGFLEWLKCLAEADWEKLAEWLCRMDYEMRVAGFKKFVQVLKPEWEYAADEVLGDKPYFTLDGLYYIQTQEDNFETVKLAIELLFQSARSEYVNLMEGLLSEVEDELEEEAYRRRQVRLSERGFPELESAIQIYQRLGTEEFAKLPRKKLVSSKRENSAEVLPQYPVLWSQERLFLDDVLLNLSKEPVEALQAIQEELVWLSNKVLACEGINLASEDKVRHAVERVRRFVNIGLEVESGLSVARAQDLVKERWLEFLFRRGFSQLVELRSRLEELIRKHWASREEAFLNFLGEPYENVCRGLLKRYPVYYDADEKSDLDHLRDFKSVEEMRETGKFLEALGKFLSALLRQNKNIFEVITVESARREEPTSLTQLVGTLFARFALTGQSSYQPVSRKELGKFFDLAFDSTGEKRGFRSGLASGFIRDLMNGKEDPDLESFVYRILARVEDDFSGLSGKRALDAKYISTVRIQS